VSRGQTTVSEMTDLIGPDGPEPGEADDADEAQETGSGAQQPSGYDAATAGKGHPSRKAPMCPDPRPPADGHARPFDRRHMHRWVPRFAGLVVFLVGLGFIVVATRPELYLQVHGHMHSRLHRLSAVAPFTLGLTSTLTRLAFVVIGLLLLMLSHGLRRRKRRAWQEAMVLLVVAAVVNLFRLHHVGSFGPAAMPLGFGLTALLIGFLWYYRREFYAVGDPRTRWRALGVFAGLLAADVAIGLAYMVPRSLHGNYSYLQQVESVLDGLVGVQGPVMFSPGQETRADLFGTLMGTLGVLTAIITAYLFLRPAEPQGRLGRGDEARVRALLDRYGDADSLGYFALRADKNIIWSPTGKSCIGYRVLSGVMLGSGDPIGDPEAWPGAIGAFLDHAARHAWVPAVMGCSEHGAEVWCREGGLTALELGDEGVVEVAEFSLQGRPMRNVRQMVTRVCRTGYVAEVRRVGEVPPGEVSRLVRQADAWRGNPTERGFSMALGRIGGRGDDRCVIATATQNGVLRALLHFVPWGDDGLSLDLMRRDRSAQPGLNDFMIVETIRAASELGVKRISLNFAMFRAALERGERIGAGPILRAWRRILVFLSKWFQIESLYKFNAKFAPEWVPRFMVFTGPRDAIRIGLAALEAEAFLAWPTIEPRRFMRKLSGAIRRRPAARRRRAA
jgi:lysyl-tRNA synthetase, class II